MRKSNSLATTDSSALVTPAHKAAIILASLSREAAKAIVADVSDEQLGVFMRTIGSMKPPTAQLRHAIAAEFITEVLRQASAAPGGNEAAARLLTEITDQDRAERINKLLTAGDNRKGDLWRRASSIPTERFLAFLLAQRPSTVAAILSNIPPERAAEIMSAAPIEFSRSIASAIARLERPDASTNDLIAEAIEAELATAPAEATAPTTVSDVAIDILDAMSSSVRDGLIEHLQTTDEGLAAAIRKALLTFDGLPTRLTEVAVAALVRTVDRDRLLCALKHGQTGGSPTVEFLLANMSKRMADQLREELTELAAPTPADGEGAQRAIVATIKALDKSGEIKLRPAT